MQVGHRQLLAETAVHAVAHNLRAITRAGEQYKQGVASALAATASYTTVQQLMA